MGAKVNGKMVALNSTLTTGDVVEILTQSNSRGPSWDWLKFVKSGSARAKIRQFFKREMKEENAKTGRAMLEAEAKRKGYNLNDLLTESAFKKLSNKLVFSSINEMMASVGYGAVGVNQVIFKLIDYYKKEMPKLVEVVDSGKLKHTPAGSVTIKGMTGLLVRFAHCCNPVPGDDIIGFVSRGRGIIVHRSDCTNLTDADKNRLQPAQWTGDIDTDFLADIKIISDNYDGVTAYVISEIAAMRLSFTQINGRINKDKLAEVEVRVKLNKRSDIDLLINRLKRDKRVLDVYRTTN